MNNEKSKSEILNNQIIEKATNRYFNYHNNKDAIDNFLNDNKDLRNPKVIKNIIKRDSLKKLDSINKENEFEPILIELYQQCIEDDFYWQYCPLVVYKKYVNVKLKEYQLRNKGASEKSFFMDEISRVKDSAKETNLLKSKIVLYFDLFLDYTENIKMVVGEPIVFENDEHKNLFYNTQKEKIEYLNKLIKSGVNIKKEITFKYFFDLDKINIDKVNEIHKCFEIEKGKRIAALVHLLVSKYKLIEIIPNTDKALTKFISFFEHATQQNVQRYYTYNGWGLDGNDKDLISVDNKLNEILNS